MLYSNKYELDYKNIYDFIKFLSNFNKSIQNIRFKFKNYSSISFDEFTFSNPEKVINILQNIDKDTSNLLYNCNKNQFIHNINIFMKHDYYIIKKNSINSELYDKIFTLVKNM